MLGLSGETEPVVDVYEDNFYEKLAQAFMEAEKFHDMLTWNMETQGCQGYN